jgi:hypothetical protein
LSYSSDLLNKQDLEVIPKDWTGEELNIRVWALLQLDDFIERVGWIEHTSDWDLFYEITGGDETFFTKDVTPLNFKGEPYTMENGVNDLIVALRIEEYSDLQGEFYEGSREFKLDQIDRIFFG